MRLIGKSFLKLCTQAFIRGDTVYHLLTSIQIIKPNEKFSALVLVDLDPGIDLPKVYKINENLVICTNPPFGMSKF